MSDINDELDNINKQIYVNTEYVFSAITELIVSFKLRNKYLKQLEKFCDNNKKRLYSFDYSKLEPILEDYKKELDIEILIKMREILENKKDNSHDIIKEIKNILNGWI